MVILQNFSGNPNSQRFIFTDLSEACCEAMRWKHLSWDKMAADPVEPDLALYQSLPDLLRNLLRNPVEPDLALYQSLPDLLQNLLRNHLRHPVEPNLALHQSLPDLHRNLLRNPVEPDLALHRSLQTLEPSPEPCSKASWNLLRNLLRNPVERDLALHQSLPNLLRNLWNLVEPDLAPAQVHNGAILGWRPD